MTKWMIALVAILALTACEDTRDPIETPEPACDQACKDANDEYMQQLCQENGGGDCDWDQVPIPDGDYQ